VAFDPSARRPTQPKASPPRGARGVKRTEGGTLRVADMRPQRLRRARLSVDRWFWFLAASLTWSAAALAQSPPVPVNPRAAEFDFPPTERSAVVGYWLEVFLSGSDTTTLILPLRTVYLEKASLSAGASGSLRLVFGSQLDGLADGDYVAVLRAAGRNGTSSRSAPSEPFSLSGRANRPFPPAPATRSATRAARIEPPSQSPPAAATSQPDPDSRPRRWILGIIAVVVAVVLVTAPL
jgi:hypothetical protein